MKIDIADRFICLANVPDTSSIKEREYSIMSVVLCCIMSVVLCCIMSVVL